MKVTKNNLDEMQEMKLLKIEHTCCWIAVWGLAVAILIQNLLEGNSFRSIAGECIILTVLSVYLLVGCIKNGIWDRKLKANTNTNLLVSLLAGAVMGAVWFAVTYYRYGSLTGSFATFLFMLLFVSIPAMLLLTFFSAIYKARKRQLDRKADREETEE